MSGCWIRRQNCSIYEIIKEIDRSGVGRTTLRAEHQKKKAIEEMGELITAISREQDGRATTEQVITEIADVQIMMRQLSLIYGIDAVANEIDRKQRRLLRRMDKELKAPKE